MNIVQDNGNDEEDWDLARQGIILVLNNKQEEAEKLFSKRNSSVHIAAGHCFVIFMNALMTFENDKLQEALQSLRDMEKRCAQDVGWLKAVRNRVFGGPLDERSLADKLEEQIILADSQVCSALLTFLQQDMTSYVRGGWALRKAWRVYQHTYTQILNLFKRTFGVNEVVPGSDFPSWQVMTRDCSVANLQSPCEWTVPSVNSPTVSTPGNSNGMRNFLANSLRSPLSIFSSFTFSSPSQPEDNIPPHVVARLMAGVSFGYGIFQLCVSLLPPNLLRFIHFFGFEGDRCTGLNALMFTRQSRDFRAPLATLALLWYHTIVRPFFALDGKEVKTGLESAEQLVAETLEFKESSLFLFFEGRIHRLKCNMSEALRCYETAINGNPQREVQLLCLHEVGWCHLIQLDWSKAHSCFYTLMHRSRWSHMFYAYMVAISAGSSGETEDALHLFQDLCSSISPPKSQAEDTAQSGLSTLELFIWRRVSQFSSQSDSTPNDSADSSYHGFGALYCKLLCIECLYLWNALPSCGADQLNLIIQDCTSCTSDAEPMLGLCHLLVGAVWIIREEKQMAIKSFRQCLHVRGFKISECASSDCRDKHVTVFALYELGNLLCETPETREEGVLLLTKAQTDFKEYDSESRVAVRIHSALCRAKQLSKSEEQLHHEQ